MNRTLLRVLTTTAVVATLCAGASPGPAAAAATTPGYMWYQVNSRMATAPGLTVYVSKGSHAADVTASVKFAVAEQRRFGVKLTVSSGYATKTSHGIVVSEGASCGTVDSATSTSVPHVSAVMAATVVICPAVFQHQNAQHQNYLRAFVLREMGKAVGLGSFVYTYQGSYQIMNPMVQAQAQTYQSGDINGMLAIAKNTASVAKAATHK